MPPAFFEWHGVEYEHEPKSSDWYWAVGIIATALVIAAILFQNYLFAILVVIAAIVLTIYALRHPPTHRFAVVEHGLLIDRDLYPFERMHSFTVFEFIEEDRAPMLSIKNDSWLAPHLVIPLNDVDADALYAHLLDRIDEGNHEPHTFREVVAGWLGF